MSAPTALLPLALACACAAAPRVEPRSVEAPPRVGDEVVVCGRRFAIGTPVVLWDQPPYYDASRTDLRFATAGEEPEDAPQGLRYQPGRVRRDGTEQVLVEPYETDPERVRAVVDQLVLHYDVAGTSETCFRVLHDQRGLSVHFLLDLDGTLYQTLDLRDQAFHATKANPRSIGVEIANVGAYPPGRRSALDEWYRVDAGGPYVAIPERLGDGGLRTAGFVARPARPERVRGVVQGQLLEMHDLTREQYDALVALAAGLARVFPRIDPDAPRGADGAVGTRALEPAAYDAFRGILGHHHVQANKVDPGPAFDWEPFLARVRARIAARPAP